jgi:DNA-binding transcriptional MerR regulator
MAKHNPHTQGAFSFFDETEKREPVPQPRKNTLKPPAQIEVEDTSAQTQRPVGEIIAEMPVVQNIEAETEVKEVIEPEKEVKIEVPMVDFATEADEIVKNESEKKSTRGRKSAKEHSLAAELIQMPDDDVLFQKHYYSMGEVTAMFNENYSLIRYWESEFDILKPKKNKKGDRFFRPEDIKNLQLIYDLLRRQKFTIEGAREYLKNNKRAEEKFAAIQSLQKIKDFFLELKAGL